MTDKRKNPASQVIITEARDLLKNSVRIMNWIVKEEGKSKSEYLETISMLSDSCSQLAFGKGFCKEAPVKEIRPQNMYLTLQMMGFKVSEIREFHHSNSSRSGQLLLKVSIFKGSEMQSVETIIFLEYMEDEVLESIQVLLKNAAESVDDDEDMEDDEDDDEEE